MEQNNNIEKISSAASQQLGGTSENTENVSMDDIFTSSVINSQQGQYGMSDWTKKAMERIVQEQFLSSLNVEQPSALEEFAKEKPDFFKTEGRKEILNYLQNSDFIVDKDEINMISQMVERLEKCAIERYLKQQAYEKNLSDENELAKRKLTANAQNNSSFSVNKSGIFTREQIGRMSGAEFTKNEPIIMEQLKKGLIK